MLPRLPSTALCFDEYQKMHTEIYPVKDRWRIVAHLLEESTELALAVFRSETRAELISEVTDTLQKVFNVAEAFDLKVGAMAKAIIRKNESIRS